ncbi:MAG: hypothetical protein HYR63_03300 [Proteobacteria bacterium]|nr:hypothetical protein [Pseudomonadota bacterium]MBI3495734.1 hypothetical protein [Pseudomonadota bacterium]
MRLALLVPAALVIGLFVAQPVMSNAAYAQTQTPATTMQKKPAMKKKAVAKKPMATKKKATTAKSAAAKKKMAKKTTTS